MKNIKILITIVTLMLPISYVLGQDLTVSIEESGGGCGLTTNCDNDVLCVDIVMSISEANELKAYNIWVSYDQTKLSRKQLAANDDSGDGDKSCVMSDAVDTDIEESQGAWRVAGVEGSYAMDANVQETIHTICFKILDNTPAALVGELICVGGNKFNGAIPTSVTFTNVNYDGNVPETCLTLDNTYTSCSLLPVQLLNFEAKKNESVSELTWSTSSELNNLHFEVESSKDGKNFDKIGVVLGSGTTTEVNDYEFLDREPFSGVNFYRLKQVDFNGEYEYSDIKTVDYRNNSGYYAFPNPASDHLVIKSSTKKYKEDATFQLFNKLGQLVKSGNLTNNDNLSVSDLDNGMYILRIVGSNQNILFTQKINILK